jgi:hypothetical protein
VGAAVLAALAGGAWLVAVRPEGAEPAGPETPRAADRPLAGPTALEIADPQESRRVAEIEERRGRYEALRLAFGAGKPASLSSAARLDPVLRALWPDGSVQWKLSCLGTLCRVDAPGPVSGWQPRLEADLDLIKLVERVVVDPDGKATPAFMVLVGSGALPGDDVLAAIEEDFRLSSDARECLSRTGATGKLEYVLQVDTSGYTFRQDTDLPYPIVDCIDRVLNEILDRHPPPKPVRTASRTFTIRR